MPKKRVSEEENCICTQAEECLITYLRNPLFLGECIQAVFKSSGSSVAFFLSISTRTVILHWYHHLLGTYWRLACGRVQIVGPKPKARSCNVNCEMPIENKAVSTHDNGGIVVIWNEAAYAAFIPRTQSASSTIARRNAQSEPISWNWTGGYFFHIGRGSMTPFARANSWNHAGSFLVMLLLLLLLLLTRRIPVAICKESQS
jgi:hypothetical protein